jgi:hypothetical protein
LTGDLLATNGLNLAVLKKATGNQVSISKAGGICECL